MTFPATVYVTADGNVYGASETDQAYTRASERTVAGRLAVCAGTWFGSQMSYRPYRAAIKRAAEIAAQRESSHAQ